MSMYMYVSMYMYMSMYACVYAFVYVVFLFVYTNVMSLNKHAHLNECTYTHLKYNMHTCA